MDSSKVHQLLELEKRLVNTPALEAVEQAARRLERLASSPGMQAAEQLARKFHESPGMKAAALATERLASSPGMQAAEQLARKFHESPGMKAAALAAERLASSPGMQVAEQLARQFHESPGMKAAALAAERLASSAGAQVAEQLARQFHEAPEMKAAALAAERLANSPGMKAAALATERLASSPGMQAAEQLARQFHESPGMKAAALATERFVNSPALKTAVLAAGQLARMPPLSLTPELFSTPGDERLRAAIGRLERADDVIAQASQPERAVEGLAEDAATVNKAARLEAKEGVNAWTRLFWLWLLEKIFVDPALEAIGEVVLPVIVALLIVTAPPGPPPVTVLSTVQELEPVTTALALPGGWAVEGVPVIVERAGPAAADRVVKFFTDQIHNANTRAAYGKAVTRFFGWCDERGLELNEISRVAVATYVEELQAVYRTPTINQHLAAIRRLFDWLVVGEVVPRNPAATVRGPTLVGDSGKTPVLESSEVRRLLESIDMSMVGGLRDRALLGVMIFSCARVSVVVHMDVDDYYLRGRRWWLRLGEKGGKQHVLPVHHKAEAYLNAYLEAAGIGAQGGAPLWRTLTRTRELGGRRLSRVDVFRMVKRRVKAAGLGDAANCHTFRASGITAYLLNGGTLERAQAIAGHESPRTTKRYDRTADDITVEDIERINI